VKDAFFGVAEALARGLGAGEVLLSSFHGERSDFVRFNRGKVRQAGSVEQGYLTLRLVKGKRHTAISISSTDSSQAASALGTLREIIETVPEDPWLLINETPRSTTVERRGTLPSAEAVVEETVDAARGRDLVGIYAGGTICAGFANSLGQRNWHEADSFNFDWSLYLQGDQAVKSGYAGFDWEGKTFRQRVDAAAQELRLLDQPRRRLEPGEYRAYLAPRALEELTGLLGWGGFSARACATRQTPLLRMSAGAKLSPRIRIAEKTAELGTPAFQGDGFVKPPEIGLIESGVLKEALVSPRSAKEYGLETNAANGAEMPEALDFAAGTLETERALAALDTGLYISNLWYLNFSDRPAGRITGMTRFATFWVEGGKIVAPTSPMRFDDSIYRMLGENLVDLTRERQLILDTSTYGGRSMSCSRLPGALLASMSFTL
jgi:predicted Zn-dependent protease